ncbi:hypothetical protein LCGC14_0791280, partial [marine sediment metagenome]
VLHKVNSWYRQIKEAIIHEIDWAEYTDTNYNTHKN